MSADQPLTGDELATIKARAERARDRGLLRPTLTIDEALRLVAEVERLQAALERSERMAYYGGNLPDGDEAEDPDEFTMEATSGP